MHLASITIENFRCFGEGDQAFKMTLNPGLTALVGENDSGKTAVIDAIRFALGTSDQEWNRLEDDDFNANADSCEIRIVCKFESLTARDKRAFVEYLTYGTNPGGEPTLYVHWTAKNTGETLRGQPYRRTEVRSGASGDGPQFHSHARALLNATYLRPLRDAEQVLSAGRRSRLAQVLLHSKTIRAGCTHDIETPLDVKTHELSVLGIAKLIDDLLEGQKGVKKTRDAVDAQLEQLALSSDSLKSLIRIGGANVADDLRIRQMLEKLDIAIGGAGKSGLGSNNLLFMACEMLLIEEENGSKLLLIEEPEAHLHAQRQLRAMKSLQKQAKDKGVQVIVTTHSPNLASAIDLDNIVMIHRRRAFSMAQGKTELEPSDYRFLQRFLDVTKANLFFARGVMIVEGDAENILLPTLARLIGHDFTEHGVSIVNVGGVGLRRYARVFQRKGVVTDGRLDIPVACVTDMDVMPNCAPSILGKVAKGDTWPQKAGRRWLAKRDFNGASALADRRKTIENKASGQTVKTFVSDEWTLEYDLALSDLAKDVYIAAHLAKKDEALSGKGTIFSTEAQEKEIELASTTFLNLQEEANSAVNGGDISRCSVKEVLASHVYAMFAKKMTSKTIAAQYLAERLQEQHDKNHITPEQLRSWLPKYLVEAIEYVTSPPAKEEQPTQEAEPDE